MAEALLSFQIQVKNLSLYLFVINSFLFYLATTTDATTSTVNFDVSCVNVSNSVPNTVVVATVPPLGSIDDNAGDAESLQCTMDESNSSHHTVAHISPRVEQAHSNEATFPQLSAASDTEMVKNTIQILQREKLFFFIF